MIEDAGTGLTTSDLESLVSALGCLDSQVDDAQRIDQIAVLERVKSAVAAAQVRVTAAFVASQEEIAQGWRQRAKECSDGNDFEGWRAAREEARRASFTEQTISQGGNGGAGPAGRARRRSTARTGIAAQVGLARRESPTRGSQRVTLALTLTGDMPYVLAALTDGVISEWRATLIVREATVLTGEQRRVLDAELAGTAALTAELGRLGDRKLEAKVKAIAYRLDPASVLDRARRAEGERRVSLRPAPDTMAYLSALLPVAQAVAAYAALTAAADTARAGGDQRGKGQVMADTLVARVTGLEHADAVPVEVGLVMTDRALLAGADTPAQLVGYGPVPAQWARDLLTPNDTTPATDSAPATDSGSAGSPGSPGSAGSAGSSGSAGSAGSAETPDRVKVWLRRLYTHPADGTLVGMDSPRRVFDGGLRRFLLTRDGGTCRTPYCDAPIRHLDHVTAHADGGPTSAGNGQGLCVRCNLTKQQPGWRARTIPSRESGAHTVELATPTGHTYTSTAPPLIPGLTIDLVPVTIDVVPGSPLERHLHHHLAA